MNFLEGELVDGDFVCPAGRFATGDRPTAGERSRPACGPRIAGSTAPAEGKIDARVYATELIGDHTLITCQVGETTVTVKADKAAQYEMDEPIGIAFADRAIFLFDAETGARIRGGQAASVAA